MSTDKQLADKIGRWLEAEAPTRLPDRVLRATFERTRTTRQQRGWRAVQRRLHMNRLVPIGIGVAAVVALGAVGINLLPGAGSGTGGSQPSPSPTVAPTTIPDSGALEGGVYLVRDGTSTIRVTVPAGWDVVDGTDIRKHRDQPNEIRFAVNLPDINVWPDACATGELPPPTGPSVDDLVAALRAQQSSVVSEPAEITLGGLPGVLVEVSVPDGLDAEACDPGALRIWSNAEEDGNFLAFSGPGTAQVYIVEAPSGRIVLSTGSAPEATASDLAELEAIVDSATVEAP